MRRVAVGRVLVIVGFVVTVMTIVPLALAWTFGAFASGETGYAFVPLLLIVVMGWPYVAGCLAVAAVLALIGAFLGGYRGLGIMTVILAVAGAVGLLLWIYGTDAGWF